MDHFVVLTKVTAKSITIHDPAIGKRIIKFDEVSNNFTGIAVEFSPRPELVKHKARPTVPLSVFFEAAKGFGSHFAQAILLSIAFQVAVLITPLFFIAYFLVRLYLFQPLKVRTQEHLEALGREQSHFSETVRAMQAIKIFHGESNRETQWWRRAKDVTNTNVRMGVASQAGQSLRELFLALLDIAIIYIATFAVLDGEMTVGMMVAILAYKAHFSEKAVQFIENVI